LKTKFSKQVTVYTYLHIVVPLHAILEIMNYYHENNGDM